MSQAPIYWRLFCIQFLKAEPKLAQELWLAFVTRWPGRVATTVYMLDQMVCPGSVDALEH